MVRHPHRCGGIAGTVLGVRFLWGLQVFFVAVGAAFAVTGLIQDGFETQLVGGSILSVASLVLILMPSVKRFENKRLSLLVENPMIPDIHAPFRGECSSVPSY